jgi:FlaA1/EpsC-like NDP-sugar epimerase
MNTLKLIGRESSLFVHDLKNNSQKISDLVLNSSFLVLGAAGSIGQAVSKEIFKRNPRKLYLVDISENNMVELVRDLRSSIGYIDGDFQTFALDIGSWQFDSFLASNNDFDYVLNLTALKHVRSEKDPYTLMRLIETNILNTIKTVQWSKENGVKKYFAVSTDKATNPVNMMGASKRIMELFLMRESLEIPISTARFANVAFSDGSLLHSFNKRFDKKQPIVAPSDVRRYFVTPEESGLICLFSTLLGENRDVFFPILSESHLLKFSDIASNYIKDKGFEPFLVDSEEEARLSISKLYEQKKWPCFFANSDTTGEKDFEEFFAIGEELDFKSFKEFGVIKNSPVFDNVKLESFINKINTCKNNMSWSKIELLDLFKDVLPNFEHEEKGKSLESKM